MHPPGDKQSAIVSGHLSTTSGFLIYKSCCSLVVGVEVLGVVGGNLVVLEVVDGVLS